MRRSGSVDISFFNCVALDLSKDLSSILKTSSGLSDYIKSTISWLLLRLPGIRSTNPPSRSQASKRFSFLNAQFTDYFQSLELKKETENVNWVWLFIFKLMSILMQTSIGVTFLKSPPLFTFSLNRWVKIHH